MSRLVRVRRGEMRRAMGGTTLGTLSSVLRWLTFICFFGSAALARADATHHLVDLKLAKTVVVDERVAAVHVGPLYVEGEAALLLQRLPVSVLRSLAAPVGVMPLFRTDGFGVGVYGRFQN